MIYDCNCSSCGEIIKCNSDGEPALEHKNIILCVRCSLDLIEPIYKLAGTGGIQILKFKDLLSSGYNREKRSQIKNYKSTLKKLLHKYKFQCVHCGNNDKESLTIDHIFPVSKGGSDSIENLQILCKACNSKKGAK